MVVFLCAGVVYMLFIKYIDEIMSKLKIREVIIL